MIRLLILFLGFCTMLISAEEFSLSHTEANFRGMYRHQTYIKQGSFVHIDDHYKVDNTGLNVTPYIPEFVTAQVTHEQQEYLIKQLISLGVHKWKIQYPESTEGLICDGHTFQLFIKSSNLTVNTRGICEKPQNYKEVVSLLESIYKTPNK
ncbi:hypothetical protein [Shewanella colwelliana]|uniref:hypothetical protein n=1 Tax=Shewanella colwelliana TaxID=23 RepID=UPI000683EFCA|nr:hypothetical protein [Shewanella colwelliana]